MASKDPPDSLRLWEIMETMDKPQLLELLLYTTALATLRQGLRDVQDMRPVVR
jgi:hypothetical protein